MGIFGDVLLALITTIFVNPVVWLLELLGLHGLAFQYEEFVIAFFGRFGEWEDGINESFDEFASSINPTFDQATGGTFEMLAGVFNWLQSRSEWIAGVGDTWANWFSYVSGAVPRFELGVPWWVDLLVVPGTDINPGSYVEGMIQFANAALAAFADVAALFLSLFGVVFIPVGYVLRFVFGVISSALGVIVGLMGFYGSLTGLEAVFALSGIILIAGNILLLVASIKTLRARKVPKNAYRTILGLITGGVFILYTILNVPGAIMMIGVGAVFFFMARLENNARLATYGITLILIGSPALHFAVVGEFLAGLIFIPVVLVLTIGGIEYLTGPTGRRIGEGGGFMMRGD